MRKYHRVILPSLSIILVMSSCITHNKLTYLKDLGQLDVPMMTESEIRISVTPSAYRIMPYDNLFIRVITPDPQWSEIFNVGLTRQSGTVTQESASLLGYPVDNDGYIEIPFVGKMIAAGRTLSDLKAELDTTFKHYVTDAAITVRLVNNYVSLVGELRNPGRYLLTKDRINIFEAISLAGDMTEFSDRQKVQLIRPSPFGPLVKEFSLSDRSILTSEFYYVMPNDIIYVKPMSGRMFSYNTSIYSLLLNTITTALVIISYFRIL